MVACARFSEKLLEYLEPLTSFEEKARLLYVIYARYYPNVEGSRPVSIERVHSFLRDNHETPLSLDGILMLTSQLEGLLESEMDHVDQDIVLADEYRIDSENREIKLPPSTLGDRFQNLLFCLEMVSSVRKLMHDYIGFCVMHNIYLLPLNTLEECFKNLQNITLGQLAAAEIGVIEAVENRLLGSLTDDQYEEFLAYRHEVL